MSDETATRTTFQNSMVLSPLKRYQKIFCSRCEHKCTPASEAFLVCILAAILDQQAHQTKTQLVRGY